MLEKQKWCCGGAGAVLYALINKDKAAPPWKNSFFYSGCPFKRKGWGKRQGS